MSGAEGSRELGEDRGWRKGTKLTSGAGLQRGREESRRTRGAGAEADRRACLVSRGRTRLAVLPKCAVTGRAGDGERGDARIRAGGVRWQVGPDCSGSRGTRGVARGLREGAVRVGLGRAPCGSGGAAECGRATRAAARSRPGTCAGWRVGGSGPLRPGGAAQERKRGSRPGCGVGRAGRRLGRRGERSGRQGFDLGHGFGS